MGPSGDLSKEPAGGIHVWMIRIQDKVNMGTGNADSNRLLD